MLLSSSLQVFRSKSIKTVMEKSKSLSMEAAANTATATKTLIKKKSPPQFWRNSNGIRRKFSSPKLSSSYYVDESSMNYDENTAKTSKASLAMIYPFAEHGKFSTNRLDCEENILFPNLSKQKGINGGSLTAFLNSKKEDPMGYLNMILNSRVYEAAKETELQHAKNLSAHLNNTVYLKREDTQPVFSFKIRGAYNKMAHLTRSELDRGVVACSAGNHAQGVAISAQMLNCRAIIVMPLATPSIKVDSVRVHGGSMVEVRLFGNTYDEAAAEAKRLVIEEGMKLIHPFDDPLVIAGQGTIGMEILKECVRKPLDAVFVCCGGGGMLAGIASYVKRVRPNVKVIGVEARDAAGMTSSLHLGEVVSLDTVGLFADGAAVKTIGTETFRVCENLVDEMVTVTTDQICNAIKLSYNDSRVILEPAGALAVAGMKKYVETNQISHQTLVAITSGANMDFDRLRFVSERADESERTIAVTMPKNPRTFRSIFVE